MKILFLHRWVGVHGGGTETQIRELVRVFIERGHEVSILTRQGSRPLKELLPGVRVWRVSKNFLESDHSYEDWRVYPYALLFITKMLVKLLWLRCRGEKFDVISVHFTTEAVVARIYRALFKTPFVYVLEGYTPLEGRTALWADRAISISHYEAERYKKTFGLDSVVIPVGIDTQLFHGRVDGAEIRRRVVKPGGKLVVTVCRLEPRKDIPTLLKAAVRVHEQMPDVRFFVAGAGISERKLRSQSSQLKADSFVTLAGFLPNAGLPPYYAAADLFVLPTLEEGFGIVYPEAMACGVPILTTNIPAALEVVGSAGEFVPVKSPEKLSEKIVKILSDSKKLQEMRKKSLQRAKRYDWEKLAGEYEKVYQQVAGLNSK